jgi:hypothetical protein
MIGRDAGVQKGVCKKGTPSSRHNLFRRLTLAASRTQFPHSL